MTDPAPYNPLEKRNLGASVAEALLGRKPKALSALTSFKGAGVYAIYYRGDFPPYRRLALLNGGEDPQAPIYVGKAIPAGGRKGGRPKKLSEDATQIIAFIRSSPDTKRQTMIPQQTLGEIRVEVEKHLKNTYLRQVQAPVGVNPVLRAWMELN